MDGKPVDAIEAFKAGWLGEPSDPMAIFRHGFARERVDLRGMRYFSSQRIKALNQSPAHFEDKYILGNKDDDTPSKRFGRLLHSAVLQPNEFLSRYIVMPEFSGTGMKKAKEEWLAKLPPQALVVNEKQADEITRMIKAVYAHPDAKKLLSNGTPEVHAYAFDTQYVDHEGLPILWYGIIDFYRSGNVIVELKGTKNSRNQLFAKDMDNYGYNTQGGIYQRIVNGIVQQMPAVWTIAVENKRPNPVSVFRPSRQMMDRAIYKTRMAIEKHNECQKSGWWYGYHKAPMEINDPAYVVYQDEEEEDDEN